MYKSFEELNVKLSEPVLKTLRELDFQRATPIQVKKFHHLLTKNIR